LDFQPDLRSDLGWARMKAVWKMQALLQDDGTVDQDSKLASPTNSAIVVVDFDKAKYVFVCDATFRLP